MLIHTNMPYTRRCSLTQGLYDTHKLLHTDVLPTNTFTHKDAFTHRRFYTHMPLHTGAFTHRRFYTQMVFAHRRFYTKTLVHTDPFAQKPSVFNTRTSFRAKRLPLRMKSKKNISFWHSNIISCERVATGPTKLKKTAVFETRTLFHAKGLRRRMLNRTRSSALDTQTSLRAKGWPYSDASSALPAASRKKRKKKETREREKIWRYEDVKMRRWEDVRMRRCEDGKMLVCEGKKMWRCEGEEQEREREGVWRCADVRMWGRGDVKMSRCEDVSMWRWEDVSMWRCEHVKMYSRPPLLDEPFAHTLSGKTLHVQATAARSKCRIQNGKNTTCSHHSWKFRCRKVHTVAARSTWRSQKC